MLQNKIDRRQFIQLAAGGSLALALPGMGHAQQTMMTRTIPATGEHIPVVGLGTSDEFERIPAEGTAQLKAVLSTLLDTGGTLVDTAPAYGNAESVLGRLFGELNRHDRFFMSTKISLRGTAAKQAGVDQMIESEKLLGKSPLDLILVHNLNDLDTQWQNLVDWKAAGRARYIGITISQYGQFNRFEAFVRKTSGIDFVQLNYSMLEPRAGEVLIPLAVDKGAAVMVNRPFGNGGYFGRVSGKELPDWAGDFDCESWAQFSLKWILANENVTCVIPATSNPRHMLDNARAGYGRLPDPAQRRRISEFMQSF